MSESTRHERWHLLKLLPDGRVTILYEQNRSTSAPTTKSKLAETAADLPPTLGMWVQHTDFWHGPYCYMDKRCWHCRPPALSLQRQLLIHIDMLVDQAELHLTESTCWHCCFPQGLSLHVSSTHFLLAEPPYLHRQSILTLPLTSRLESAAAAAVADPGR